MIPPSDISLFVGDLPKFCNEKDLLVLFEPFGPSHVKIKRGNSGKSLSYGFVSFGSEAAAGKAMAALDGSMFLGRSLR